MPKLGERIFHIQEEPRGEAFQRYLDGIAPLSEEARQYDELLSQRIRAGGEVTDEERVRLNELYDVATEVRTGKVVVERTVYVLGVPFEHPKTINLFENDPAWKRI